MLNAVFKGPQQMLQESGGAEHDVSHVIEGRSFMGDSL